MQPKRGGDIHRIRGSHKVGLPTVKKLASAPLQNTPTTPFKMDAEAPTLVLPTTPPRSQRGSKRIQRRRRRIQTACKSCQDRKTRCDGSRPACSACHRRGVAVECIYENSPASARYLSFTVFPTPLTCSQLSLCPGAAAAKA